MVDVFKGFPFLWSHKGRIIGGVVLIGILAAAVLQFAQYHREQRIVRNIEAAGGTVNYEEFRSDWIPRQALKKLSFLDQASYVTFADREVTTDLLREVVSLRQLLCLQFNDSPISDEDLKLLEGLPMLQTLELTNTRVTDEGLKHLQGLTTLDLVDLSGSRTTAEGRAVLRNKLPHGEVTPNP